MTRTLGLVRVNTVARVAMTCALVPAGAVAGAHSAPQAASRSLAFDIPEQPLAGALARFATVSGVDIAYPQHLALGRRSHPVRGPLPPPVALQTLLQGTGLAARFTGPKAAIVYVPGAVDTPVPRRGAAAAPALRLDMAEVRAPIMVGTRDRSAHQRYAMAVQNEVRALLQGAGGYEGHAFRLEIRLAVDPGGVIRQVAIRRQSGEPAWDRHVASALTGRSLSIAPPADLAEPLAFEVVSDRLREPQTGRRQQP